MNFDYSGKNICSRDLQSILDKFINEAMISKNEEKTDHILLDLSNNRLDSDCLESIYKFLDMNDKISVDLSVNYIGKGDLDKTKNLSRLIIDPIQSHKSLEQIVNSLKLLNDIVHSLSNASNNNNKLIEALSTASNNNNKQIEALSKNADQILGWIAVDAKGTEQELRETVINYFESRQYVVDEQLQRKIYTPTGNILLELDGIMSAEKEDDCLLLTVKAKHNVDKDGINNRLNKLQKFKSFLRSIPTTEEIVTIQNMKYKLCCERYIKYKNVKLMHYIGGEHFPTNWINYAHSKGFNTLELGNGRYTVVGNYIDDS